MPAGPSPPSEDPLLPQAACCPDSVHSPVPARSIRSQSPISGRDHAGERQLTSHLARLHSRCPGQGISRQKHRRNRGVASHPSLHPAPLPAWQAPCHRGADNLMNRHRPFLLSPTPGAERHRSSHGLERYDLPMAHGPSQLLHAPSHTAQSPQMISQSPPAVAHPPTDPIALISITRPHRLSPIPPLVPSRKTCARVPASMPLSTSLGSHRDTWRLGDPFMGRPRCPAPATSEYHHPIRIPIWNAKMACSSTNATSTRFRSHVTDRGDPTSATSQASVEPRLEAEMGRQNSTFHGRQIQCGNSGSR